MLFLSIKQKKNDALTAKIYLLAVKIGSREKLYSTDVYMDANEEDARIHSLHTSSGRILLWTFSAEYALLRIKNRNATIATGDNSHRIWMAKMTLNGDQQQIK